MRHALRHRPDHIVVGELRGTEAAELSAWDALARHATTQVSDCRRGAAPADRTRRRWASSR